jgi:ABC-type uncharacterized transport system permease subunit
MNLSLTLLWTSCLFYLLAFVFHAFSFQAPGKEKHALAFGFMRLGFLVSTFYFFAEAVEHRYFLPVTHASSAMAFFAWSLGFVYLVLLVGIQSEPFGLILTPVLLAFSTLAGLSFRADAQPLGLPEDAYFAVHVVTAFFAYACFTISFAASVLYLIQQRELKSKQPGQFYYKLPALEALEKLIFQPMVWGAGLLLTAVTVGFLWSKAAFGSYWLADPKTLAALATVACYAAILYLHYIFALRGQRVIVFSLVAFGMVIVTFLGMRLIDGSHQFH